MLSMDNDSGVETRVYTVHLDVVEPLCLELQARVRLRHSIVKPRWWQFLDGAKIAVTGPAAALDALPPIIEAMEQQADAERQW